MKFSRLQLTNFTVFEDATFDFCPGINVLIGANGTGKSHVLKAAYSIQSASDDFQRPIKSRGRKETLAAYVDAPFSSLQNVFNVELEELIRRGAAPSAESTDKEPFSKDGTVEVSFRNPDGAAAQVKFRDYRKGDVPCVFIPSREFLAAFEGFISAWAKRESSFDRTYFDLCIRLSALRLRGKAADWANLVASKLELELPGSVELKEGRFYIGADQAHVVAEGHRKLATAIQLIRNGSISRKSTLYWDEPESGLNPKLVKVLADALLKLAANDVQIIVATHDYLLTYELSLAAEYQTAKLPIKFFCLNRESTTDPVSVQVGQTLAELDHNPILEEFTALYEREQSLYYGAHPAIATGGEPK